MIFFDLYLYMYMCFMSFFLLILSFKYMLIVLIMIELVIINISMIMFMMFSFYSLEFYMIFYLVFSVCDGVLGLALLVNVIRYYGNEYYYMFNMSKF